MLARSIATQAPKELNLTSRMQTIVICRDSLNIEFLNSFFKRHFPEIVTIASARDIASTIEVIDKTKIDLLFVDSDFMVNEEYENTLLQLEKTGMNAIVLTNTKENRPIAKKFPTLHFIYKPITVSAFERVLRKIKKEHQVMQVPALSVPAATEIFKTEPKIVTRFVAVAQDKAIELIRKDEIQFIKGQGKYTSFILKDETSILSSRNLGEYERDIQEDNFVRIHQSYMVNLDYVVKIVKEAGWLCFMENGCVLPVSRRRKEEIYIKLKLRV